MFYVYFLENDSVPARRYVGMSADLKRRLAAHNSGTSPHTAKFRPWHLVTYVAFSKKGKAEDFERYLKSGSGHAFAKGACGKPPNASELGFFAIAKAGSG